MPETERTMLLVLGMHRSGTSAMAGTLKLLGVDLGPKLQPGNEANVRGYFEHRDIVELHDKFLGSVGSHWADPTAPCIEHLDTSQLRSFRREIVEVLRRDFGSSDLCAVKDPRLSRLLGLWQAVAADLEASPMAIILFRSPWEVAESLARRDGLAHDHSYLLWLDHLLSCERDTRAMPRMFVSFEELLADWRGVARRVGKELSLTWPAEVSQVAEEIDGFLDARLKHHNEQADRSGTPPALPPWVERIHDALRQRAEKDDAGFRRTFSVVRRDFENAVELFGGRVREARGEYEELFHNEAKRRQKETEDLRKHTANLEERIEPLEDDLARHRVAKQVLEDEIRSLKAHGNNLEVDLAGHRAAKQLLEEEIRSLKDHGNNLEVDLAGHRAAKQVLEEEIRSLKAHGNNLEVDLAGHRAAKHVLEQEIESLQANLREISRDLSQHRLVKPNLEKEIEALRAHADNLESALGEHRTIGQELARDLRQVRDRAGNLEADLAQQRTARVTLERQLEQYRATQPVLEREIAELTEERASLEGEVQSLRAGALDMGEKLDEIQSARNRLQEDLSRVRKHAERLEQARRHMENRAEGLATQTEWLSGELQSTTQQMEALQVELASMRASRSWRITRPIRSAGKVARSLRSHLPTSRIARESPAALTMQVADNLYFHIDCVQVRTDTFQAPRALRIAGWCFAGDIEEVTRLEVRSDDLVICMFDCSKDRKDVLAAFPHLGETSSLPRCGFDDLCPLEEGADEIEVRCSSSGHVLLRQSVEHIPAGDPGVPQRAGTVGGPSSAPRAFPVYLAKRALRAMRYRNVRLLWRWRRLRAAIKGEHQRFTLVRSANDEGPGRRSTYETYVENNRVAPHVRALLVDAAGGFSWRPTISVILAITDPDADGLEASIQSLRQQIYDQWELCITDAYGGHDRLLDDLGEDRRFKITTSPPNRGTNAARNDAANLATGEYLVFLEQGDLFAPHAFFEIVALLQSERDAAVIYSDEDMSSPEGMRFGAFFKPDWSPTLLLGYDYMGHMTCVRRALYEDLAGFPDEFPEAGFHALWLRISRDTERFLHIPKVLYHARADSNSRSNKPASNRTREEARRVVEDHIRQVGLEADVFEPEVATRAPFPLFQLDWPDTGPTVSIIIPTYNQGELLRTCIDSIQRHTTYLGYEIVVLNNGSDSPETLQYLETIGRRGVRVVELLNDESGFSFSAINNRAADLCTTDYLLFLNNDTEVVEPRWLSRMMGYAQLPGVGAVGARLMYPNGTIQHAGVLLDQKNGLAPGHAFLGHPGNLASYFYLAETARDCIAVTAACLLTSSATFQQLGGFLVDEFRVSLQDVDYCMRLREAGLRSVYVAGAELIHHETLSRPREDDPVELARFKRKYRHLEDPYYNRNLSLGQSYSYIPDSTLDYTALRSDSVKVVGFLHNLNLEGASMILLNLALNLARRDEFELCVVSYQDGPLGDRLRAAGVDCRIVELPGTDNVLKGWPSEETYKKSLDTVARTLEEEEADLAIAMVLNNFFVVQAAARLGIPSLWLIQETYDAELMARNLSSFTLRECQDAFAKPHKVIFGSEETQLLYERFNQRGNFTFIHNSIDRQAIDTELQGLDRRHARSSLGIKDEEKVVLSLGTICPRKNQETLVKALGRVVRERSDFSAFIVGAREEEPYLQTVRKLVSKLGLDQRVKLVPETEDVWRYYLAADIFAFSSLNECFSLSILEAMAFGLPIITTPCGGIGEQVRVGVNAFTFRFEDHFDLQEKLTRLIADDELREAMGRNSLNMHSYMQSFEEMLARYERLLNGAWLVGPDAGS